MKFTSQGDMNTYPNLEMGMEDTQTKKSFYKINWWLYKLLETLIKKNLIVIFTMIQSKILGVLKYKKK